jgi:uncharacterized protein
LLHNRNPTATILVFYKQEASGLASKPIQFGQKGAGELLPDMGDRSPYGRGSESVWSRRVLYSDLEEEKKMKLTGICILLLTLVACGGSGGSGGGGSVSGTKDAKVEELLTLMKVEAMQKQMMDNMQQMITNQLKSTMPSGSDAAKADEKQKKMFALIAEKTSWQSMKPIYIKVYSDTYNDTEVDGILLFYRSAAGKAMVDKQPALLSKITTTMQATMADLAPQIQKIMTE